MSKFKGKRMVEEDLIKKLQDLDPSSGPEYTAGTGIEISAENEISIDTDTVATKSELFSGDYDDLTNKPDLSVYAESADLATVATTGSYNDLSNKPTIPAGVTVLTISTSVTFTSTQIAKFIANPGNYLFKEVDGANGDDYFRINTIRSAVIMLTKTYVASSTTLYSEIFYINRSTGAVTKYNYTVNVPTAPTLNKTTETLTFTYSDNTTGTLTVVTDVTLS